MAGFDVIVIDDRDAYASRERFPEAQQVIAEEFERRAQLTPNESLHRDCHARASRRYARTALGGADSGRYIGMIGSKRKTITIFKELQEEGFRRTCSSGFMRRWGSILGPSRRKRSRCRSLAELIAKRRKVERELPHMSWFHGAVENPRQSQSP